MSRAKRASGPIITRLRAAPYQGRVKLDKAALLLAGLMLTAPDARAARPPDPERAIEAAEALVEHVNSGPVDEEVLRTLVIPEALPGLGYDAEDAFYRQLTRRLGPGQPLTRTLVSTRGVLGVVRGPEYQRVVLDSLPTLTLLVRRGEDGPAIERLEFSACTTCSEPERFVVDLFDEVRRTGSAHGRLAPGVELWLDDAPEAAVEGWRSAVHRRNEDARYLRWLLSDARVLSSEGDKVRVALRTGEETWAVTWRRGRWGLDYARLAPDSALRFDVADVEAWVREEPIPELAVTWWTARWSPRGGAVLVHDEVLDFALRPLAGEVLVYDQDLGRDWAVLAALDQDTGEVVRRLPMPLLSREVNVYPDQWASLFRIALEPAGNVLAISGYDNLWFVDVRDGSVLARQELPAPITALRWSPEGEVLALGDAVGGRWTVQREALDQRVASPSPNRVPVGALQWMGDQRLLVLSEDGTLEVLQQPEGVVEPRTWEACCGAARGLAVVEGTGQVLVGCCGRCDPAYLWTADLITGEAPEVLADARFHDERGGTVSAGPMGLRVVTPSSLPGGRAALWHMGEPEPRALFSDVPLDEVAWDPDGRWIWTLDQRGRLMRWPLEALEQGER